MSKHLVTRPVLGAEKSDRFEFFNQPAFDQRLFDQIDVEERWLAVYGYIRYRGGPKREYTTRFLWWNARKEGWVRSISEDLNLRD
jgi:hypothetical protein